MNAEVCDAARVWLGAPIPVAALRDLVCEYLVTPLPMVDRFRVALCDCSCNCLKPEIRWKECTEARQTEENAQLVASLLDKDYKPGVSVLLHSRTMLAYTQVQCAYFELNGVGYIWADKSLEQSQWPSPQVQRGSSVLLTLPHVPRPWNNDFRNTNHTTLQWPFLVFSTNHRDGPLFAAHVLDLCTDLRRVAVLQVFLPFSGAYERNDASCFLQQGCLFVGIHGRDLDGDRAHDKNRLAVFSLEDLDVGLPHRSMFAPEGCFFRGTQTRSLVRPFDDCVQILRREPRTKTSKKRRKTDNE
jgi:hypothetical protein